MADRPDESERQEQRNREGYENELWRRRLESLQPARRADYERNQQPCYEYDNDDACASDQFTHIGFCGVLVTSCANANVISEVVLVQPSKFPGALKRGLGRGGHARRDAS